MRKYFGLIALLCSMALIFAGCGTPVTSETPGMANPASVFCEKNGGTLENRTGKAGEYGVCKFNDGSECSDWAYYRGECKPGDLKNVPEPTASSQIANPASGFCLENGGELENRTGKAGEYGVCKFNDGTECGDWAYMRGECKPGEITKVLGPESDPGVANPAAVFCQDKGGTLETRTGKDGEYGVCKFTDGSECSDWAYYRGECRPGDLTLVPEPGAVSTYENTDYGFSLTFPADWFAEESDHNVIIHKGGYQLYIGYYREGEEKPIFRTGMPSGEFIEAGNVPFLNVDTSIGLPKRNLMLDGKVKVVQYALDHLAGDLHLYIWLDPIPGQNQPYKDVDIPVTMQSQADQIVSSFTIAVTK